MNDSEVVSALYHCNGGDCEECKALGKCHADWTFLKEAYRLIKRQQAEIEGLKKIQQTQADRLIDERGQKYEQIEVISKLKKQLETTKFEVERNRRIIQDHETIIEMLEKEFKTTKSETIREFAERLKKIYPVHDGLSIIIDQIVEEMIGEM